MGTLVIVAEPIPDEAELVGRSRQGDVAAFRQLVATHAEPLWRCARALCRDDHEAEDLTQETLVEERWSRPGDRWRGSTKAVSFRPGSTAFSGTGS